MEQKYDLEVELLLNSPYDKKCDLEIHAGAGGTESCDWALMLKRMYSFVKKYKTEIIDEQGEEVELKVYNVS